MILQAYQEMITNQVSLMVYGIIYMQIDLNKSNCCFSATNELTGNLTDFLGKWVILYFYPKDSTPGCTTEGRDFTAHHAEFESLNAKVFGISKDSLKSHHRFKEKEGFSFELISDEEEALCKVFDVIKQKSMYGKTYMGIERSTFLINPQGQVVHEWRNVKVPGHVKEVLETLKQHQS